MGNNFSDKFLKLTLRHLLFLLLIAASFYLAQRPDLQFLYFFVGLFTWPLFGTIYKMWNISTDYLHGQS